MEKESCLNCRHKDVCIMRSITIFELFIVTGREAEVGDAQKSLNIRNTCKHYLQLKED